MQQVSEMPYKQLHLVIGFVNDKDVRQIMKFMPSRATFYFVRLSVPRTMNEMELASLANRYGLKGQAFGGIREATEACMKKAGMNDLVIITGSNFLVADFLTMKNLSV
jgi:dihydrofolate synthase/folylpolyglutamate synthase